MHAQLRRGLRMSALALACALALPAVASGASKREDALEKRVSELEHQVQALMDQIKAQREAPPVVVQAPPPPPPPAEPKKETPAFTTAPGMSVAFHGFVDVTAFSQNKSFTYGNGQNAEFPVVGSKGTLSGVDIRNTRFWLDITGARLNDDWTGGGRIEMDFFGGFNGTGAYSLSQPTPRLRQAYLDLSRADSGTKVRVGQQWDLMFPIDNIPTSLSHLAFPLGYGTGVIGWRYPGVVMMQDLNHGAEGTKWRLDVGAFEGSWNNQGTAVNHLTAGNPDFRPQLEARIRAEGSNWLAYAAAHYADIDLKGVDGAAATPVKSGVKSTGVEIGGSWKPGAWNLKGLVYTGKGLGPIFGAMSQFGDIQETGGFFQVGYNFTKNWSVNAFFASAKPDSGDVLAWAGNGASGLLRNRQTALNLHYASGPYQLGLEFLHDTLKSISGDTTKETSGNQIAVSAMYTF